MAKAMVEQRRLLTLEAELETAFCRLGLAWWLQGQPAGKKQGKPREILILLGPSEKKKGKKALGFFDWDLTWKTKAFGPVICWIFGTNEIPPLVLWAQDFIRCGAPDVFHLQKFGRENMPHF
jgi:hypothetical protein